MTTDKNNNPHNRLYNDLAWTWPIISPPEDYIKEGELFAKNIRLYQNKEVKTLLNLGSGGGHVDWAMKKEFRITGVDISENMLKLARKLNPEVEYLIGDMRDVRLNRKFDAVLIHDAINYMTTPEDLLAAFKTAAAHLDRGGIFMTFVEECREHFVQNQTRSFTKKKGNIEITFIDNNYDPDPSDTNYEYTFVFLIRRDGQLEVEYDCHIAGLFTIPEWEKYLKKAGFRVINIRRTPLSHENSESLPVFIGIKE